VCLAWHYDRSSGVYPPEVKLPIVTGRKGETNKATAASAIQTNVPARYQRYNLCEPSTSTTSQASWSLSLHLTEQFHRTFTIDEFLNLASSFPMHVDWKRCCYTEIYDRRSTFHFVVSAANIKTDVRFVEIFLM
jgi:hypothetical protein